MPAWLSADKEQPPKAGGDPKHSSESHSAPQCPRSTPCDPEEPAGEKRDADVTVTGPHSATSAAGVPLLPTRGRGRGHSQGLGAARTSRGHSSSGRETGLGPSASGRQLTSPRPKLASLSLDPTQQHRAPSSRVPRHPLPLAWMQHSTYRSAASGALPPPA